MFGKENSFFKKVSSELTKFDCEIVEEKVVYPFVIDFKIKMKKTKNVYNIFLENE